MKKLLALLFIFSSITCLGQSYAGRVARANYNHSAGRTEYYDAQGNYLGCSKTKGDETTFFDAEGNLDYGRPGMSAPGPGRQSFRGKPEVDVDARNFLESKGRSITRQEFNSSSGRMEYRDSKGRLLGYSRVEHGVVKYYDNRNVLAGKKSLPPRRPGEGGVGHPAPGKQFFGGANFAAQGQGEAREQMVWDGKRRRYTVYDASGSVVGYYSWDRRKKEWRFSGE